MTPVKVSNFPAARPIHSRALAGEYSQETTALWRKFKQPLVRDLAWLIFSPDLVCDKLGRYPSVSKEIWGLPENTPRIIDWLYSLENTQHPSSALLPQRSTAIAVKGSSNGAVRQQRLGHYFEALIAFALQSLKGVSLSETNILAQNLQVIVEGKTQGEFDFLLRQGSDSILHLEVAVKFFLLPKKTADYKNPIYWLGPNAKDKLGLKLDHMQHKQLSLAERSPSARSKACEQFHGGSPSRFTAGHIIKGMLFVHWSESLQLPLKCNRDSLFGYWLYRSEFEQLIRQAQGSVIDYCLALAKTDWLTSHPFNAALKEAPPEITLTRLPVMYSVWHRADSAETLKEKPTESRIMVVEDYWPETKSPSRII